VPERNPYLILGVDFGASHDDARRAFAHAARRIRRSGGAWEIEDLNWALHEIEALESDPADSVSLYRVPADPEVFEPQGGGLLRPAPVPLSRRTLSSVRRAAMRDLNEVLAVAIAAVVAPPPSPYAHMEADR
jgi:hypothetical protein